MNLKIIPTPNFTKSIKRLAKKYTSIVVDLEILHHELISKTYQAIELGNHCFKMRLANSSIQKGKSGGFRIIFFTVIEEKIYLLDIYSKTELDSISDEKIITILKDNELLKS